MRGWLKTRLGPELAQVVTGLVALPLSVLPFVAYGTLTAEGRLVRERAAVWLSPPELPALSPAEEALAEQEPPRYDDGVMVLAYHGIGAASDRPEGRFVVSAETFGSHLAILRAAGMRTVTASEAAVAMTNGRPLPSNAVMITFDDGRADAMLWADPLLEQAGMRATMFVIADAAEHPGVYYASWDSVGRYARSGRWDIQSHTAGLHRDHDVGGGRMLPALTSLSPGESLDGYRRRVDADLRRADAAIAHHTGRAPVAFAYPFGAYGADRTNDPGIRAVLREELARRYTVAFQQDDQWTIPLAGCSGDLLTQRRLEVGSWPASELLSRISRAAAMPPTLGGCAQPPPPARPTNGGQ